VSCEETTLALGAYTLGALDPDERGRVEDHVRECPGCAAELAEFRDLPALLDRVRIEDLQTPPMTPSPDLFDRVASAAAAEDRRVRRRWLLVAAAVAVVLAGGVGGAVWANRATDPTYSVVSGPVHVTVRALANTAGTTLDVTVAGLPPRTDCWLVVVDEDGQRHDAGWWQATYEGEASFRGWTDVPRPDVADLLLVDEDGVLLVRVPL
jgi:anti-sigma factor RsiW